MSAEQATVASGQCNTAQSAGLVSPARDAAVCSEGNACDDAWCRIGGQHVFDPSEGGSQSRTTEARLPADTKGLSAEWRVRWP